MTENAINTSGSRPAVKEKLWTKNFLLLWQGQLVSSIGDVIYEIALGFWILAVTGSTGLMGTLMAASTLPRVIISPFAGVIVDRKDRRKILITMDIVRGIFVTLIGVSAFAGILKIWMVFAAGVILGVCGAFFSPAVNSALPDVVSKTQLVKANSTFSAVHALSNILGNSAGGFLFSILGAPVMFLFNGISFLFSGASIILTDIPNIVRKDENRHFASDLREGLSFVWRFKGLRDLLLVACGINFFANIGLVLFMPYFQKTQGLGPVRYGIAAAVLTGGMLAGMIFTSLYNISPEKRLTVFSVSIVASFLGFSFFPLTNSFALMLPLLFVGGFFNAIINVFNNATMQQTIPQEMRGKVFGLTGMAFQGLTPIAMAIGGIIAEFIPIKAILISCFLICIAISLPITFMKSFKSFINFNPETQTIDDIM